MKPCDTLWEEEHYQCPNWNKYFGKNHPDKLPFAKASGDDLTRLDETHFIETYEIDDLAEGQADPEEAFLTAITEAYKPERKDPEFDYDERTKHLNTQGVKNAIRSN